MYVIISLDYKGSSRCSMKYTNKSMCNTLNERPKNTKITWVIRRWKAFDNTVIYNFLKTEYIGDKRNMSQHNVSPQLTSDSVIQNWKLFKIMNEEPTQ